MKQKDISLYELAKRQASTHTIEKCALYQQLRDRSDTYGILRDKIDTFAENLEMHSDPQYAQTVKMELLQQLKNEINRLKIRKIL